MNKIIFTIFASVLSLTSLPFFVFACSPAEGPEPVWTSQDYIDNADNVFKGRVISVEETISRNPTVRQATTTVEVFEYWKGNVDRYVTIFEYGDGGTCTLGYKFVEGSDYLFYTDDPYGGRYNTHSFAGEPIMLNQASERLAELGRGIMIGNVTPENKYTFARDLTVGDYGEDVKKLQQFLNQRGYVINAYGPGSIGNESYYFGPLTKVALMRFQQDNLTLLGITRGTGYFGSITRNLINNI